DSPWDFPPSVLTHALVGGRETDLAAWDYLEPLTNEVDWLLSNAMTALGNSNEVTRILEMYPRAQPSVPGPRGRSEKPIINIFNQGTRRLKIDHELLQTWVLAVSPLTTPQLLLMNCYLTDAFTFSCESMIFLVQKGFWRLVKCVCERDLPPLSVAQALSPSPN